MKTKISVLRKKMLQCLLVRGLSLKMARIIVEPFIEAELRGKKTHGLARFFFLDESIRQRQGKPKIVKNRFNYALIDGRRELGQVTADLATDVLIKKAKRYGNATVAVINSDYYAMAGTYARKVADAGLVGILMNNGGPAAVVAQGGKTPILGTNPVAIGIPSPKGPIVLDMATSIRPWGEINLAKLEKRTLSPNAFLDKNGKATIHPEKATAILPFGGSKGYGLNLMLEIMTGAFVGAKMGRQSKDGYDLGFFFMAFSPDMFTTSQKFNAQVLQLAKEIKRSKKMPGVSEIFLPGEQSDRLLAKNQKKGFIKMDEKVWEKLQAFSKGVNQQQVKRH